MTGPLKIPHDHQAEQLLAAAALHHQAAANSCHHLGLTADHFYDQTLGRIYTAALNCPTNDRWDRITWVAEHVDRPKGELERLLVEACLIWGSPATWVTRLHKAARARKVMAAAAAVFDDIGTGADPDQALARHLNEHRKAS